ncbi:MAG: tRNA epoxyqueuosine(34) reductase QueG [Kiritimatiellae bacterium]|nr:tRNA epoxyqueuosine(34) reductase QueG [Kiritimatiellia bacterium]
MKLTDRIKYKAIELGFDFVGVSPAHQSPRAHDYYKWLKQGFHGNMKWLANDPERRSNPTKVLPQAQSVISVGLSYFIKNPQPEIWNDPSRGRIARYAWGQDYHDVIEPMLKTLSVFIQHEAGEEIKTRYYVDTGPVLERDIASQAGLGFVGKNTLLIHPDLGSYVFLGEIITDLELDFDEPPSSTESDHKAQIGTCGNCRRCLDVCPTHAFPVPYILNSKLCISYLTIELKGSIPLKLRPLMKNWIYGCDACQEMCPWVRRYSKPGQTRFLEYDPDFAAPRLMDLIKFDNDDFKKRFKGSPITRTKRRGLLRNAAVALGNWGNTEAIPVLKKAAEDPEPLIREHAAWAIEQIETSGEQRSEVLKGSLLPAP